MGGRRCRFHGLRSLNFFLGRGGLGSIGSVRSIVSLGEGLGSIGSVRSNSPLGGRLGVGGRLILSWGEGRLGSIGSVRSFFHWGVRFSSNARFTEYCPRSVQKISLVLFVRFFGFACPFRPLKHVCCVAVSNFTKCR